MASADGGEQEPGGSQLAVPDGPQLPGGGQQMPQDEFDPFPHDGGQQEPGGSPLAVPDGLQVPGGGQQMSQDGQLAVPDGQLAVQMPERLTIGTKKAFEKNDPFPYEKKQIGSETIYVCTKGGEWTRTNEVLVLRCLTGTWTAFDSAVSADGLTLQCRQPVFRCLATDITQPGWHKWETNYNANPNGAGLAVDWQGTLCAETRLS